MARSSRKTALILAIAASSAAAQDAPPGELPDGPLRVIISEFAGNVQARQLSEQPWAPIAPGQEFDEGVEFRTGVRSVVKFKIPPDSEITLDRLGVVKILRASIENGTIKTDVGMKYGRTRYDIEAAGRIHDAKIRSATSVLAIRGTEVILEDTPGFAPRAVSFTGRAQYNDAQGRQTTLGSPNATTPSVLDSEQGTVAQTTLQQALPAAPINNVRTPGETQIVNNIPQIAGIVPPAGIGGSGPIIAVLSTSSTNVPNIPTPPPVNLIPGRLEFILNWNGLADLQIGVVSPLGEPITTNPASVTSIPPRQNGPIGTSSPSGGIASADNTGGSGAGAESVVWANGFPQGRYDFGAKYNAGSASAQFRLDVIVNGVTLEPATTGNLTGPTADEFNGNAIDIGPAPGATNTAQRVGKKKRK